MIIDPNVNMAIKWADGIGPPPKLPSSLNDISTRLKLLLELDNPYFVNSLMKDFNQRLGIIEKNNSLEEIAQISKKYLYDISEDRLRSNISLRLWAGCLTVAKIISYLTLNGPNTPEYRNNSYKKIIYLSQRDPIFKAGAETAVEFKKSRNEKYSFEGIPKDVFFRERS